MTLTEEWLNTQCYKGQKHNVRLEVDEAEDPKPNESRVTKHATDEKDLNGSAGLNNNNNNNIVFELSLIIIQ